MYDQIQALLTSTINIVAIAGLGGIIAHALYNWHLSQLPKAPKANPDYQRSELVNEILETLRGEAEQAQVSEYVETLEDDGLQGEYGFETVAEEETAAPQQEIDTSTSESVDLNSLDAVTLRKLCTQHQIAWRNVRGHNRHATKGMMIYQLQRLSA